LLFAESKGQLTRERLKALTKAKNGFELAEYDLQQRGAGELYGRRQWGISDIGMEALKNPRLITAARTEALALVNDDPTLKQHPSLLELSTTMMTSLHNE
jgi:ATP-dependent DNA helicase RecG